jgi:hypothetical protein
MDRNLAAAYLEEAARILRSKESLLQGLYPEDAIDKEGWQKEEAMKYIARATEEMSK